MILIIIIIITINIFPFLTSWSTIDSFPSIYGLFPESTSIIIYPPTSDDQMNVLIKRLPLSLVDESPLFNLNGPTTLLSSASTLDLATYSEDVLLLISIEILTPSPLSDLPL